MKGARHSRNKAMKKMSVLIISEDKDYCSAVGKYFRNHYSETVIIITCSSLNNISDYIRNNNITIILSEEDFYQKVKEIVNERCIVCKLVENKTSSEEYLILKYISASSLYNELLFLYSKLSSETGTSSIGVENLYTFISVNGCGATTLSVSFAKRLAKEGKKVLFLGLDGLSDYSAIFGSNSERGLSDIILALKSKTSNVSMTAKSVTCFDEVYFIDKCRCADDIYEIDSAETEQLLNTICSSDRFDAVVMDISFAYTNIWNYVSKYSKCIFCITTNRTASIAKTNNFIETVKIRDFRNNTEAIQKVSVIVNRSTSIQPVAEINSEHIVYIQRYSSENYKGLTEKIAEDSVWNDFIKR